MKIHSAPPLFDAPQWRPKCESLPEAISMNWDIIQGQWKQVSGRMKEKWGKLTDGDWQQINGRKDQLIGKLQERYGYNRDQAEREIQDWERSHEKHFTA